MAARLCRAEREEIRVGIERGWSYRRIGAELDRDPSAIQREVTRNGGRGHYRAARGQRRAEIESRRPRRSLLASDPELAARVAAGLKSMAPAPLARLLRLEGYRISAETIYRECYRKDSALGESWRLLLRARRWRRRRRHSKTRRNPMPLGQIRLIDERHAAIPHQPGHWEGDLIAGSNSRSAAVVLTERTSRIVLLGALQTQTATEVTAVTTRLLATVPPPLKRTLCWDQGRELAHWPQLEANTGITIYFCHPRSPWQKPLVENTCGLLRRWLPRNGNLYQPQHELDTIAHTLNNTPRRIHNWQTAQTRYDQLVATTS